SVTIPMNVSPPSWNMPMKPSAILTTKSIVIPAFPYQLLSLRFSQLHLQLPAAVAAPLHRTEGRTVFALQDPRTPQIWKRLSHLPFPLLLLQHHPHQSPKP